eukprot:3182061-Rhodomonas_salina.1
MTSRSMTSPSSMPNPLSVCSSQNLSVPVEDHNLMMERMCAGPASLALASADSVRGSLQIF